MSNSKIFFSAFTAGLLGTVFTASAEPALQIYLEGANYNTLTESWEILNGSGSARLWVIGNVKSNEAIVDVHLAVSYSAADAPFTIELTPSTTGGYNGFTDSSIPVTPTYLQTVTDGSLPRLGDGSELPNHGGFGPGIDWQEFLLGDFDQNDSPIADFSDHLPSPNTKKLGQINVYDISVNSTKSVTLHFDVYDHYYAKNKVKCVFAPFSHDGDGTLVAVPAPAGAFLVLMGLSLVGWAKKHTT